MSFTEKFIWKLKIPLKMKIYLKRCVILTKDNLAKRNQSGSKKYCLCDSNETIKHIFFECQHAKTIQRVVNIATGLTQEKSITHMLSNQLIGISKNDRSLIFMGVAALTWAIWCTRNDLAFEKKNHLTFLCILAAILIQARHWRWLLQIYLPRMD